MPKNIILGIFIVKSHDALWVKMPGYTLAGGFAQIKWYSALELLILHTAPWARTVAAVSFFCDACALLG